MKQFIIFWISVNVLSNALYFVVLHEICSPLAMIWVAIYTAIWYDVIVSLTKS